MMISISARRQEKEIINELFENSPAENRCHNIKRDQVGPYCSKDIPDEEVYIPTSRRLVCDVASLQLWCLDKERCDKCIHYENWFGVNK
jgi:hypothetical protein